jgi:hypothetical protein
MKVVFVELFVFKGTPTLPATARNAEITISPIIFYYTV